MQHQTPVTGVEESWFVMAKSIGFVYGVPSGLLVGALVAASVEVSGHAHGAAKGVLVGVGSGLLIGAVVGTWETLRKYRWVQRTVESECDWDAVVKALNVKAAAEHYLLVTQQADYVAYSPTLARPVAGGPLTVSGEYLSVVVARLNPTTITITGPERIARKLEVVARAKADGKKPEPTPSLGEGINS
jgi:hypothetical protein